MSTRTGRRIRIPKPLEGLIPTSHSALPSQYASVIPNAPSPIQSTSSDVSMDVASSAHMVYNSEPNTFGIFRQYSRIPQEDPEADLSIDWSCDAPRLQQVYSSEEDLEIRHKSVAFLTRPLNVASAPDPSQGDYGPFDNASQFRLCDYFYGRSDVKSKDAFDDFVNMLHSQGFKVEDLEGFSAAKAERLLDEWVGSPDGVFSGEDGWYKTSVFIPLPKAGANHHSEDDAPQAEVKGVVHRRLLDLIKGVVTDSASRFAKRYHWVPHMLWWNPDIAEQIPSTGLNESLFCSPMSVQHPSTPSGSPMSTSSDPQADGTVPTNSTHTRSGSSSPHRHAPPSPYRVLTDCYNSDAILEEDEKIQKMPRIEGDDPSMEYAIIPLLAWSDETHLSSFGSAALWPIYIYFGNLSKYVRGRPTEFMAQHLAYIPSVRIFPVTLRHCGLIFE